MKLPFINKDTFELKKIQLKNENSLIYSINCVFELLLISINFNIIY